MRASVDRAAVRVNESFTYTIRAEGALRGDPELGPLEQDFDVLDTQRNRAFRFVNGQSAQVTEWRFQLMPKAAGTFALPAVRVRRSRSILRVSVVDAEPTARCCADRRRAGRHFHGARGAAFGGVRAIAGDIHVALVHRRRYGPCDAHSAGVSGGEAIVERLGEDNQYQTTRGGRTFIVRERRYAIFPQEPGALTVGPATFEAMVIPDRGFSRVRAFGPDRSSSRAARCAAAASVADAVWLPAQSVTLSEVWSDATPSFPSVCRKARTVTVEADGLLETQLPELVLEQQAGVRQYADQPVLERDVTPTWLTSRRAVSLAVIAQNPGEVTLPASSCRGGTSLSSAGRSRSCRRARCVCAQRGARRRRRGAAEPRRRADASFRARAWPIVSGVLAVAWLVTVAFGGGCGAPARGVKPHAKPTDRAQTSQRSLCVRSSRLRREQCGAARAHCWPGRRCATRPILPAVSVRSHRSCPIPSPHRSWIWRRHLRRMPPFGMDGLTAVLAELDAVAGPPQAPKNEALMPLYR